ncbi:hypothetical protein O181_059913 [Austropuccinia psidii MF-1]|uniref:Uncharacterized protein n=1 Tax=Austropuccinia psidii MF-1 TaxID=1389203 RepID=A0A9Q3EJQ6_9BASI|nr:hypothetical protein [Austropuccinia psidii MF-1]
MEVTHEVDRSGGLKGSAGKTNRQKEGEWVQWSAKEKNGKAGRPRGICTRRTTAGELERSGAVTANAATEKGNAGIRQKNNGVLADHPITQEGGREALVECAWWVQFPNAPCKKERAAFGHK